MTVQSIPVINRKFSKLILWLLAIPYFLLLVPFNWIMKLIGKPGTLMNFIGKRGMNQKKLAKVFEDYTPDEGDIFVSTFSKSGTN